MPLTALHADLGPLDATVASHFERVHRVTPSQLTCRECSWTLHAVHMSASGHRFFRHARSSPAGCSTVSESLDHLRVKTMVVELCREAGWDATPEVTVAPRRADVLAVAADGRRVAFEVQLSAQSGRDTAARRADYAAAGVDTIWVVRDPARLGTPGGHARLELAAGEVDEVVGPFARHELQRERCDAGRRTVELARPVWEPAVQPVKLEALLRAIGSGSICWQADADTWVPTVEVAAHQSALEVYECERARAIWDRERSGVHVEAARALAGRVADALERAGHRHIRVSDVAADPLAGAVVVTTGSGTSVACRPEPARATSPAALLTHLVVTDTAEDAAALHRCGVAGAVPFAGFVAPPASGPAVGAAGHALRHVSALARRHLPGLGQPTWDQHLRTFVWTTTRGRTLALICPRELPDEPAPDPRDHTVAAYVDPAAVPDLPNAVAAFELAPAHLDQLRTGEAPRPLTGHVDEVRRHLPRGRALSERALDPAQPSRGVVLAVHEGAPIVVTHDPADLPDVPAGAIIYVPGADAPSGAATSDPAEAAALSIRPPGA